MEILKKLENQNGIFYHINETNHDYFIKVLKKEKDISQLKNEIKVYSIIKKYSFLPKIYKYDIDKKYIVYQYINGLSYNKIKNSISLKKNIEILYSVAKILEFLHKDGFVHCDLNPSNIMIRNDGKLYLIDYANTRKIGEYVSYGTKKYCSLEQLKLNKVSVYFDIYALGVMLYELYSELNFGDVDTNKLLQLKKEYSFKSSNAPWFANFIILKATSSKEGIRYSTITEMKNDLKKLLDSYV